MKGKYMIITCLLGWLYACTPQEDTLVDYSQFSIDKVELSADHRQLIADGVSTLTLNPMLYQKYEYTTEYGRDSVIYGKIPVDRIVEGTVKYYLEDGTELAGPKYQTKDLSKSELGFYVVANGIKSNVFKVKIREPFLDNLYDTLVYPIVFHIIQSQQTVELGQGVGNDIIEYAVQTLNNCFMRKAAFSPNGANAKIQFRLAEYNPLGEKMPEPGVNRKSLTGDELNDLGWDSLIEDDELCWDYNKYLNVYIIDGFATWVSTPRYLLNTADLSALQGCEGLSLIGPEEVASTAIELPDIAIIFETYDFATENINYANTFGSYFGLLSTEDEAEDYCDDTFAYTAYTEPWNVDSDGNSSNYGNSRLKISTDGLIFYSVNIMDVSSYCNTISMDQVKRVRTVAEYCPYRQPWKSEWAFTGKE